MTNKIVPLLGPNVPLSSASPMAVQITASSTATVDDNGSLIVNNTTSNITKTINAGMTTDFGFAMVQQSTGTCTIAAGSGVTFIGSSTSTSSAGQIVAAIWVGIDTYIIKVN